MRYCSKWNVVLAACLTLAPSQVKAASSDIVDTAVAAGSFKTLAAALEAADLVGALKGKGPFTVFAPTDEAFSKLPEGVVASLLKPENKSKLIGVLTYHVAKGNVPAKEVVKLSGIKTLNGQLVDVKVKDGNVSLDAARVVKTDIACSNGTIHVIDQVILPATENIVATAQKAGDFKTLLAAAKAAGLVEALNGEGPFTVFAPTDEAFAKLPKGTVESLLKPENKTKLAAILKYHVVDGRVYSTDAVAAGKAQTLQGDAISIAVKGSTAMVNNAKLLTTDLDASNGVIHVIDAVLLPAEDGQTNVQPRRMIETAIHEGAPLYNAGHPDACAKIYMQTVRNLLAMERQNCASTTQTLQTALTKAQHTSCPETQAWTLRHALDMAYHSTPAVR